MHPRKPLDVTKVWFDIWGGGCEIIVYSSCIENRSQ